MRGFGREVICSVHNKLLTRWMVECWSGSCQVHWCLDVEFQRHFSLGCCRAAAEPHGASCRLQIRLLALADISSQAILFNPHSCPFLIAGAIFAIT